MENQINNQVPKNNNPLSEPSPAPSSLTRWLVWGGVFLLAVISLSFAYWQWTAAPEDAGFLPNFSPSTAPSLLPLSDDDDRSSAIDQQLEQIKLEDIDEQFGEIDADLGNL